MNVVCTGSADNKSLVYSETETSSIRQAKRRAASYSFEEAYLEFPSR